MQPAPVRWGTWWTFTRAKGRQAAADADLSCSGWSADPATNPVGQSKTKVQISFRMVPGMVPDSLQQPTHSATRMHVAVPFPIKQRLLAALGHCSSFFHGRTPRPESQGHPENLRCRWPSPGTVSDDTVTLCRALALARGDSILCAGRGGAGRGSITS